MSDRQLTERQEAFVVAYIGEARYNATEAARTAGYAIPKQSGTECLANPIIKQRINEHLEEIRKDGIGNKAVRIAELAELNDNLKRIQSSRANAARVRFDEGDDIPEDAETGLMIEVTKQVGTGQNAVITKEWQLDKTLIDSRTKILEQVAKEVGDRDKKIELTGANGGPLEVASAKSKLFDLIDEES